MTALTWGASAVLAIALVLVLTLSIRAGTRSAEELLVGWAVSVVSSVSERLVEHLEPVRAQTAGLAETIAAADPDGPALATLLAASLAGAPQLSGTVLVRPDGSTVGARRDAHGRPVPFESPAGDASSAEFAAVAEGLRRAGIRDGSWGEVVRGRGAGGAAIVNFRQPVWAGDRFVGLLTSGVRTSELARYLARIAAPNDVVAYVLLGEDQVVAASSLDMHAAPRAGSAALPRLADVDDAALRAMWRPRAGGDDDLPVPPGFEMHVQALGDGRSVAYLYEYVHELGATPWIVGCYFEGEQYDEALRRIRWAGGVSLLVLALTALATFFAGRGLGRPILRLARTAEAVRVRGPTAADPLPRSSLLEIDTASQAFNGMVEGLRERERLRATFGRYVPESVADALIADGGELRPQSRVCTTLFTDIVGFSTVSERLSPEETIEALNEYFTVMVEAIERHDGVIHQFQGDAILATFNLPVEQPDHAARAVRTALDIQAATRDRTFGPGVPLATRVGINTGPAVCGTVGGGGRLGFTVHGDDVNIAARIEQMNKDLGTRVLVADSTVALAGDAFCFTRVDEMAVRGRSKGVVVYRVAGPHTPDESPVGD